MFPKKIAQCRKQSKGKPSVSNSFEDTVNTIISILSISQPLWTSWLPF